MAIYFDNSATTRVDPEVRDAMVPFFSDRYGNPSSIHSIGRDVRNDVNKARELTAELIKAEGLDKILNEAGFEIRQPGCSACLAMNEDKIPAGKYAVSTSNRNFEGRQGPGSRTILAGPLVAAATAITGVLTDPRKI